METKIVDDNVDVIPNKIVENFSESTLYSKRFDIGLCSTCTLANICTLPPRQKEQRVVHCEEFDKGYTVEPFRTKKDFFPYNQEEVEANPISFLGLCRNCEKRNFCTLVKPLSGIWHCEEYE